MKKTKNLMSLALILILLSGLVFATTVPGSDGDPLISLSYLDKKLNELKSEININIKALQDRTTALETGVGVGGDTSGNGSDVQSFQIFEFPVGTQITFGANAEFIIRTGAAKALDPVNNRIPDLTAGLDILIGENIPKNHLILIPRADGRGLEVTEKMYIMIKGEYTVTNGQQ